MKTRNICFMNLFEVTITILLPYNQIFTIQISSNCYSVQFQEIQVSSCSQFDIVLFIYLKSYSYLKFVY